MIWTNEKLLGGAMRMVLALSLFPACGDDGAVTSDTEDTDSEGTTEDPTTTPSTSNPSTTMNPSTTGMTGETDTETTTGDTDTTGEPTTGETDTTDTETTGDLCGNGVVDAGEDCDGEDLDGQDCTTQGADEGDLACNDDCTFDTSACVMWSCGDGEQQGKELCDGADLDDQTCEGLAFAGGTLACAKNCMDFDTSGCFACGDNAVNGPTEVCDGTDLAGETCELQGFIGGGALACVNDCSGYDTTACSDTLCSTPGTVIDGDTVVVDSITVPSFGAFVGDVDVSLDIPHTYVGDLQVQIRHVDTDTPVQLLRNQCTSTDNVDGIFDQDAAAAPACTSPVGGGMNVLPVGNLDNFDGMTDSAGTWELSVTDTFATADDGTLAEWCVTIQPSEMNPASCGDGSAQFGEVCDGADLRSESCVTQGYLAGGTLACAMDCTLDTTGCLGPLCGDGVASAPEECDGADLGTATCESVGFPAGGTLGCGPSCSFDTSACTPPECGNSAIAAPEQCDTREMGGSQCEDLGFLGGSLDCSFPNCTFDTSECSNAIIALCSAPGLAIPDNTTVVDTINLADMGAIADIDVFVNITHTFPGDLDISLRDNTDAVVVDLSSDQCSGTDHVFASFNDEGNGLPNCIAPVGIEGNVTPEASLTAFDGLAIAGAWDLVVTDDATFDSGTLVEWCVYITPE